MHTENIYAQTETSPQFPPLNPLDHVNYFTTFDRTRPASHRLYMNDIYPDYGYGPRLDGTMKGPGFNRFNLPDGSIMTEFSLGPPDQLYPAVYHGISIPEMMTLSNVYMYGYDPMMYQVYNNAYNAYLERVSQGLPAFYSPAYDGPPGGYVDRGPVSR